MTKDEPHLFKRLVPGHPYCVEWESGISCGRLEHDPIHQAGRAVRMDINDCTHGDGCPVHPDTHAVHNFDADALEHGYQREIESLTARMAAALVQLKRLPAEVSVVAVVPGHDDRSRFRENVDKITKTLTLPETLAERFEETRARAVAAEGPGSDERWGQRTPAEARTGISDRNAAALAAVGDLRRVLLKSLHPQLDVIEQALRAGGAA